MTELPPPVVEEHHGFLIVREDLVPGGTKRRVVPLLLGSAREYVYASPRQGYAQLAVALGCRDAGKAATIFVAAGDRHPLTAAAADAGADVVEVAMGFLSNVSAKARRYAAERGARLLPFGMNTPRVRSALAAVARSIPTTPREVWTVSGSGMLTLALQEAWPDATFHTVKVGKDDIDTGRAVVHRHPLKFHQIPKVLPPFPSCSNYDSKCWEFMLRYASPGALFWNVGADPVCEKKSGGT